MELATAVLLAMVVASFLAVLILNSRSVDASKRLPPGPKGLPFIGNFMEIPKRNYLKFMEYSRKYGEIVYLRIGPMKFVLLNNVRAMKEALVNQADIFSNRQHSEYMDKYFGDGGIIFTDGPVWKLHRRINLRFMREFGVGKDVTERFALEEAADMMDRLKFDTPIDMAPVFRKSVTNVIGKFTIGHDASSGDKSYEHFRQQLESFTKDRSFVAMLPVIFPFLLRVPFFMTVFEHFVGFKAIMKSLNNFISEKIKEHKTILKENNVPLQDQEPADVCDALLIEQARQIKDDKGDTFTDHQIMRDLGDLFFDGTEPTTMTLTWATFLMACNPEVRERVHAEICEVVGRERRPSMKDRLQLHYVNAVIDEIMRFATIVPTGLPHSNTEDAHLFGYFIPKGCTVITCMWNIHRDPEIWEKPDEFYPEHFLTPEGRYKPSDAMVIFSMGRRACLGEGFAKMETYLFFTSLFQHLSVRLADPNIDREKVMLGAGGRGRRLLPHELIFTRR